MLPDWRWLDVDGLRSTARKFQLFPLGRPSALSAASSSRGRTWCGLGRTGVVWGHLRERLEYDLAFRLGAGEHGSGQLKCRKFLRIADVDGPREIIRCAHDGEHPLDEAGKCVDGNGALPGATGHRTGVVEEETGPSRLW